MSDSFLETNVPLLVLIEAARGGQEKEVEEYAQVFTEHANKLVEVRALTRAGEGPCEQDFKLFLFTEKRRTCVESRCQDTVPPKFEICLDRCLQKSLAEQRFVFDGRVL